MAFTIFALVVAAAVAFSLFTPERYTATTQVLVDLGSPDRATGMSMNPASVNSYLATQIDLIQSPQVSLMVVEKIGIEKAAAAMGGAQSERWTAQTLAEALGKRLEVKPARQSSLLEIAFSDTSAERAALVANAYAEAYIDTTVRVRVEPARKARTAFDTESTAMRAQLERAQNRLAVAQRASGITSTDERVDIESAKLTELSTQVTTLQAVAIDNAKRAQLANSARGASAMGEIPEVMTNPLVQSLKTEQARIERRLSEQSAILGSNHPEYLRLQGELASVKTRLAQETATITNSLSRSSDVTRARLAELQGALSAQRTKVLQLRDARAELANLQRDVDSAQRAYDRVNERLNVTSLETKTAPANIVIVAPAAAPSKPSSPGLPLVLLAAILAGTALALLTVVAIEAADRRIRTTEDLSMIIDVPVIGELNPPSSQRLLLGRS